jgi:hypothetical protein
MSDSVILIICLVIIIIFVGIIVYWLIRNSKPYTINDTVKGFYDYAQLGQLCLTGPTGTSTGQQSTLLPSLFEPQNCDTGLACIPISNNSQYGYCKAKIGNYCSSVYDCSPPEYAGGSGTNIFCSGSICTQENLGILFSSCGITGPTGTVGLACDTANLNLICSSGTCLGNIGFDCKSQNYCAGGLFCDISQNQCIEPIQPAQLCDGNYCATGFGCTGGVCEPLYPISGTKLTFAAQPGQKGAFCIPGASVSAPYSCNSGLICNIDAATNASTVYPGITGYGLCDYPIKQAGASCTSNSGACIPTLVCYNQLCQAPIVGGEQNINYCGPGTSELCGQGLPYTCVNDYCLPTTGGLCNGSTGYCAIGSCTGNKLGIFSLNRTGSTGSTQLGTWQYLDLPTGETGPSNQSSITVYQNMEIDINGNPLTKTKCVYFPYFMSTTPYFWLSEFESGPSGIFDISNNWTKYNINNSTSSQVFEGVKYTHGGNLSIKYSDPTDIYRASNVIIYNNYVNGDVDFTTPTFGPVTFQLLPPTNNYIVDWDIDDVYNMGMVGLIVVSPLNDIALIYGANPTVAGPLALSTGASPGVTGSSNWCRYITNPTGPNNQSFIANFNNTIWSPVNPSIPLADSLTTGSAFFSTLSNNIQKMELYYVTNNNFRYLNNIYKSDGTQAQEDLPIEGYCPDYTATTAPPPVITLFTYANHTHTMSMGNIDANMFALIEICE